VGFLGQILMLAVAGWTAYNMAEPIRYNDRNMIIGRGAMVALLVSPVLAFHVPSYGMRLVLGGVCLASLIVVVVMSRRVDEY